MNYRALEDLIGILIKKSGYKITDLRVLEDTDYLTSRKNYLLEEIDNIKNKLDNSKYIDKDSKVKDEEEKKYLERTLSNLTNDKNNLELKLNDKTLKCHQKAKTSGELEISYEEIDKVKDAIKLISYKLDNFDYIDNDSISKDENYLSVLESELKEINASLDNKEKNPILIGTKLLDAFKNGEPLNNVKEDLDVLTISAKENYNKTLEEIKGSNIFELIDLYSNKKNDITDKINNSDYVSEKGKEELFEKTKYHNKRIETFKSTISGIEKRKEELSVLIEESNNLFEKTRIERLKKEEKLKNLEVLLFNESNLSNLDKEFSSIITSLIEEINGDKYLENKYKLDIENFNEEMRNLDINFNNMHNEIISEERSLEIINDRIDEKSSDLVSKFEDKIKLLGYTNRVNSLYNEQQYLYVNVDVIKEEIESIWARGDDKNEKTPKEIVNQEVVSSSMYDDISLNEDESNENNYLLDEEKTESVNENNEPSIEEKKEESNENNDTEKLESDNVEESNIKELETIKEDITEPLDDDFIEDIDYF